MLDTPGRRSEMSETRANEIVEFLHGSEEIKFGNVRSAAYLGQLAQTAYHTLGLTVPGNLGALVKDGAERIGKKHPRLGLDIGPDRANHLVEHLLGRQESAYFRENDDIHKKRELLRKAIAKVVFIQEAATGNTHHHLVIGGDKIIEQRYPIPEDGISN